MSSLGITTEFILLLKKFSSFSNLSLCSDTSAVTSSTDFFKKSSGPSDEYAEGVISIKKVMKIDIFLII